MNSFHFENCFACVHPKKGITSGRLGKVSLSICEKSNPFEFLIVVIESCKLKKSKVSVPPGM